MLKHIVLITLEAVAVNCTTSTELEGLGEILRRKRLTTRTVSPTQRGGPRGE